MGIEVGETVDAVLVLIESWDCRGGPVARLQNRERTRGWDGLEGERRAQRDISGCTVYGARTLTMVLMNERDRREWVGQGVNGAREIYARRGLDYRSSDEV